MLELEEPQQAALQFIRQKALSEKSVARQSAFEILEASGVPTSRFDEALRAIGKQTAIDISFHPDRVAGNGESVVAGMITSGQYKNQFDTGISNGLIAPHLGSRRDSWERRLFNGAYHQSNGCLSDRPKYGALNLLHYWDGACVRFGSCYLRLKQTVAERCTYAFGDSSAGPVEFGVFDVFDCVLAACLASIHRTGSVLGSDNLEISSFLFGLVQDKSHTSRIDHREAPGRSLDECIEVHVHGPLTLQEDVDYVVVDHAFKNTDIGAKLRALCDMYEFDLYWNPGFVIHVDDVPADFRGPLMPHMAQHIARDNLLDAFLIGKAAVSLRMSPGRWSSWGTPEETLQLLKQLWHVLVVFGQIRNKI